MDGKDSPRDELGFLVHHSAATPSGEREHPAPWKWRDDPAIGLHLVDGNGEFMYRLDVGERIPETRDRARMALAPEMETMLREMHDDLACGGDPAAWFRRIEALLDRIDTPK